MDIMLTVIFAGLVNAAILYAIVEDSKEYFQRIKNDINNRSIRKELVEVDDLENTFENVG